MDSILTYDIDRIYRINWIFYIPGFRKKPVMSNPLRGKIDRLCQGTVLSASVERVKQEGG